MYLSNKNMGEMLSKCLFGKRYKDMQKYLIPRKGNFLNPQQVTDTNTYGVYYIAKKDKRLVNYSGAEYLDANARVTHYATIKADVKIQFIGKDAEEWATSLLFWDERSDVQPVFAEYQSQLLLGERDVVAVPFQQDGFNGEMSYLASLSIVTNITKEEILEYLTNLIIFEGKLKVEK